ncbi:MAG: autotransporter-associated beta strand repeat-containing protein, partial [Patescibacteria group bacterium]|nr:autotransporter-associated beta strand repeat-containing protein [Patescibacteria group bacterium]
AGALTKTGSGTVTLSGTAANTYTGLTTVSAGTLHLFKSSGNALGGDLTISSGGKVTFEANHQIADTAAVTMSGSGSVFNGTGINGGQFNLTETIGSLTVTGGAFNTASGGNWTVTGMASFTGGSGNTIVVGNSGTVMRFGGLSLTDMTATAGTNVSTNNSFTLYGSSSQRSSITVGASGLTLSNSRLNLRRGGTGTLGSRLVLDGNVTTTGMAASSIMEDTAGGTTGTVALELSSITGNFSRTFNIGGGGADLTISVPVTNGAATSAGIVKTGAGTLTLSGNNTFTGGVTIENGRLTLGSVGALNITTPNAIGFASNADSKILQIAGNDVTVSGLNTGATVGTSIVENGGATAATLTVNNTAANTFAGVLQNGGAGALALIKTGAGTLTLSGTAANTYTGLTTVSAGTLSLNKTENVNAIAGDIVVNGGTLSLAANHQIADTSNITVNNAANFNSNERTETVNNLSLNSSYSDPNTHRISNITVSGTLAITKGIVGINSGASATANTLTMSGGSRIDMAANTNPTTLNIGSGGLTMSGATLRLGWTELGSAQTARVNLGGDFTGSGTNSITYLTLDAPRLLDLQGGTRTFNITGGVTTIAPTIQNGGLTKTGAGTLTLTGANTYTGPTTVDAGLLLVHGTHVGGGAYTVQNSGTLGGTGTVGATVGIGSGGTLAPGASIGTLAIDGNLAMTGGSTFEWEFNSSTLSADLLNLDGNLDLDLAGGVSLNLVDLASSAAEMEIGTKFTVASYSGDWNGGLFDDYANLSKFESGANQWRIRYNDVTGGLNGGAFASYVTLTVVPEPSSVLLLLGVVLGLLVSRRRRG